MILRVFALLRGRFLNRFRPQLFFRLKKIASPFEFFFQSVIY